MLTDTQRRTAQAIINLFETDSVRGRYGAVTLIPGDTGHLTYGRSQTTLASGNLYLLLERYCANPGARFGERLKPELERFKVSDLSLDTDELVHNLLRACADDIVMRDCQDAFFDEVYWDKAVKQAGALGISTPLGVTVVYDSVVHGSWPALRDRTTARHGSLGDLGEAAWIAHYVQTRRDWLATHARADLRNTVYRMDALARLIDQGWWGLPLPLVVRGHEISLFSLAALPPDCYDGPEPGTRDVGLSQPLSRGLDVRAMQLGLAWRGSVIRADGIFGRTTALRLREYQQAQQLPATGMADAALVAALATF